MRTRQTGGFRQISWNRVTGGGYVEQKQGRGRLDPAEAKRVIDSLKAKLIPMLRDKPMSIRDLIGSLDSYETDIKKALKEIGAKSTRVAGFRRQVYTIPD